MDRNMRLKKKKPMNVDYDYHKDNVKSIARTIS